MSWNDLIGTWGYAAGASGTVTLPAGAFVIQILAHSSSASGTVAILGGTAVPLLSGETAVFRFPHKLVQATSAASTIVFTTTDSYFVEYVKCGNT